MIVFFGLLCGYKSIESIHLYAELSVNVLKKYLILANGIPSADTILRVLAKIDTAWSDAGKACEAMRSHWGVEIYNAEVLPLNCFILANSYFLPYNKII